MVDTTEVVRDFGLRRAGWDELLDLASAGLVRVVVPEVVIMEAVRQHAKRVTTAKNESIKKVAEGLRDLKQLVAVPDLDFAAIRQEVASAAESYERTLRARLARADVEVKPLPRIAHERLLGWDMSGRQPFHESGTGYRDALIWATVLEVADSLRDEEPVLFVSGNRRDFYGPDGTLAAALAQDAQHSPASSISASLTIGDALARLRDDIDSYAEAQDFPDSWIPEGAIEELIEPDVRSAMQRLVGAEVEDTAAFADNLDLPVELETPTWYNADFDFSTAVWRLQEGYVGGSLIGELAVDADVAIDGYVSKVDYFSGPDRFEVMDSDWNEHYVWAAVERRVTLIFSATLDADAKSVEHLELEGVGQPSPRGGPGSV